MDLLCTERSEETATDELLRIYEQLRIGLQERAAAYAAKAKEYHNHTTDLVEDTFKAGDLVLRK